MKQFDTVSQRGVVDLSVIQAVILCGGLGTRLRQAVPHLPKALAPIAGRPFLDYLLAAVASSGIREVVLCTGYSGDALEEEYDGESRGLRISHSFEERPLGTAGALRHALRQVRGNPLLVLNGDSLLEIHFEELVAAHLASGALATLALTRVSEAHRYGSVKLQANGEIQSFSEKSDGALANGFGREGALINAGIYVLDRKVLEEIHPSTQPVSLERDVFPTLVGRGLFGFVSDGFFIDIGVPDEYQRAQTVIPRRFALAGSHTS